MFRKIALGSALLLTLGIFQESKAGGGPVCPKLTIEQTKGFFAKMTPQKYKNSDGKPAEFNTADVTVLGENYKFVMLEPLEFTEIPEQITLTGTDHPGETAPSAADNLKVLKLPKELRKPFCSYTFTWMKASGDNGLQASVFFLLEK